jgi:hypothetical protein
VVRLRNRRLGFNIQLYWLCFSFPVSVSGQSITLIASMFQVLTGHDVCAGYK